MSVPCPGATLRNALLILWLPALIFALPACGDGDGATVVFNNLAERPCPPDSALTYDNFGAPLLLNFCTGCHAEDVVAGQRQGAPLEVNLDTVERVRALADRIWLRAGDQNDTMPPLGSPAEMDRVMLGQWLACGAP